MQWDRYACRVLEKGKARLREGKSAPSFSLHVSFFHALCWHRFFSKCCPCLCFWASPKAGAGALLQKGEPPRTAALPRQVWQQALGRENDSKRNRELRIQKQMVPSFFHIFFLFSSHLGTSTVLDYSLVWISTPKMNSLSLPYHHTTKPFLPPRLSSCQHSGSLCLR